MESRLSTYKQLGGLASPPDSLPPVCLPDDLESRAYYSGLPSTPRLLARSSPTPWNMVVGPYTYPPKRFLQSVSYHPRLAALWDDLSEQVAQKLNDFNIDWTSIDIVRMGCDVENLPVVLWIGVEPDTLTNHRGEPLPAAAKAVCACKQLLDQHGVEDIECEMRESLVYRSASTPLGQPGKEPTTAVDIDVFFTSTIGTCISPDGASLAEGTFGCYVRFPKHANKLFGVTCRHVLFDDEDNKLYRHKNVSQKPREVLLPGDRHLAQLRQNANEKIKHHHVAIERHQEIINDHERQQDDDAEELLARQRAALHHMTSVVQHLEKLVHDMDNKWKTRRNRTVGHFVYSPPISVSPKPNNYYMDWCLYEVEKSKVPGFSGNVIDLGFDKLERFVDVLNPNIANPSGFKEPRYRQLRVKNTIIPITELLEKPQMLDAENKHRLLVLKRGKTTGVTCGVTSGFRSILRTRFEGTSIMSKELAIFGIGPHFVPFSAPGDSGALVVDAQSRPAALLTGGSGREDNNPSHDITYATPLAAIFEDMERHGWSKPNLLVVNE